MHSLKDVLGFQAGAHHTQVTSQPVGKWPSSPAPGLHGKECLGANMTTVLSAYSHSTVLSPHPEQLPYLLSFCSSLLFKSHLTQSSSAMQATPPNPIQSKAVDTQVSLFLVRSQQRLHCTGQPLGRKDVDLKVGFP